MSNVENQECLLEQLVSEPCTTQPAMQNNKHPSTEIYAGSSWWDRRTRLERRLLVLLGIAVLAAVILIIVLIASTTSASSKSQESAFTGSGEEVCITEKCILSATNLLQSMDMHVDPCEDFYGYACGNWKKHHPIPDTANLYSWVHEKTHLIQRNIRDFLRQNQSDESTVWTRAKALYKSCLQTDTLDSLKLKPVFELLKMVGLQEMPPFPPPPSSASKDKPKLNWLAIAAKAKKLLSIDLLLGFGIQSFLNPNVSTLILGPPTEATFLPGFFNPEEYTDDLIATMKDKTKKRDTNTTTGSKKPQSNRFIDYRKEIFSYVFNTSGEEAQTAATQMFILEYKLLTALNTSTRVIRLEDFKTIPQFLNATENLSTIEEEHVAHISIDTLQNLTDSWSNGTFLANWTEYFSILYEGIDGVDISGNERILVLQPKYIKTLVYLMSVTSREQVELLMWFKIVDSVASHMTTEMRLINEKYSKIAKGLQVTDPRSMICTRVVIHTMGMAVISFSANSEFLRSTKKAIDEMYMNIKDAFKSIIQSSTWIDNGTKKSILQRAEDIVISTGYPKWVLDKEKLEEYYKGVEIHEGRFLLDAADISRWIMGKKLASLVTAPLTDEYLINPTVINAYYNVVRHSITFLAGYLQFPFYDLGHDALNYGITAFTMSHELHHSLDTNGIKFKNGQLGVWWNDTWIQEFLNRSKCFSQKYSKYGWDALKVNGNKTLNEDLADHEGLRTSLLAYQKFLKKNGSELMLPGLTNHTSEQLFFLSLGNFFCMDVTEMGKMLSIHNVHTPQKFRVLGIATNSEEFSRIWNCPKGSKMNPNEPKCKLW